mmetsp:Transcript_36523/g.46880  ORF Transcript_36523/g.46880 Transcript_36523/m.46880 type:complete len:395 (-) Transcript_36523:364-1548(-)
MQMNQQQPGAFSYASEPQAVPGKRSTRQKYRPEDEDLDGTGGSNIMFDKRVIRGSTYAAQVIPRQSAQKENERRRREQERSMRREQNRRRREMRSGQMPGTPPAVPGRVHMEAQTENFLEELSDRPEEIEMATQTEAFLERPPSPLFIPAKTGVDKETQIENGDLFNFDEEVVPILEVLVGKTLQLSMLELMEEEELATIRRRQREFEDMRDAELAEIQRLEAQAKRRFAEKQRRVTQEKEQRAARAELQEKVAARHFTRSYLHNLHDSVFDGLEETGHFYDPVQKEVSEDFIPWVFDAVQSNLNEISTAREATEQLLQGALEHARELQKLEEQRKAVRRQRIEAERQSMIDEEAYVRKMLADEEEAKRLAEQETADPDGASAEPAPDDDQQDD